MNIEDQINKVLNKKITRKDLLKKGAAAAACLAVFGHTGKAMAAGMTFNDNVKPEIYISDTEPSGVNGLWVDTANNGVIKYHDGAEWVPTAAVWG